jgi:serine/threonine protein kinase
VDWLRQAARGLDKAHRQAVVHRDLKPENLFLAEGEDVPPIVKILDFGIAKMAVEGGHETSEGRILGTPRYMAPEQANDAREVASAADRFAMGLIAFRLLCGRHYFREENTMKLLLEVSRGPSSSPSSLGSKLGSAFDDWFARACAHDPRQRFPTCGEQVEALAAALSLPVQSAATQVSSGRRAVSSNPELLNLEQLKAPQNAIFDLSPLANLSRLSVVSLNRNAIKDVTALVSNAALTKGANVDLTDNPIDCAGQAANVGNLVARGVTVSTSCP